jgi:SAM-dependent methyltransferase
MPDINPVPAEHLQSGDRLDYHGTELLKENEVNLPRYNRMLVDLYRRWAPMRFAADGTYTGRVLDFGAGTGTLADLWSSSHPGALDCLEIDPEQCKAITARGLTALPSLGARTGDYDYVFSSNVLEHIPDDVAALREIREVLVPGGVVTLYVPALMALFSDMDRAVGHYRRYSRRELVEKVRAAGFIVDHARYVDSVGMVAWFAMRLLGYRSTGNLGGDSSLRFFDKFLLPVSRFLDALFMSHIAGKNVLVVAHRE